MRTKQLDKIISLLEYQNELLEKLNSILWGVRNQLQKSYVKSNKTLSTLLRMERNDKKQKHNEEDENL